MPEGDARLDLTTLVVADLNAPEGRAFAREVLTSLVCSLDIGMTRELS